MAAKHTPTLSGIRNEGTEIYLGSCLVATTNTDDFEETNIINAEQFVHCVNSHDGLVEALKLSFSSHCSLCIISDIDYSKIRQALTDAKEK